MSIEWMDNFSQYGTAAFTNPYRTSVTTTVDPNGTSGGRVVNFGGCSKTLEASVATIGVGFRLWLSALPTANNGLCTFKDASAVTQVELVFGPTGNIQVRQTAYNGTVVAETVGPVLVAATWHHIEVKILIHNTTGTVEVRVDERVVINATNLDTQTQATALVGIFDLAGSASNNVSSFKDLVIWNTTGTQNTNFLGDVRIVALLPTSDNTFAGWTSTAANGWSTIDETVPDDADYVSAVTPPPAAVLFGLSDLDATVTVVKGLQTVVRALKTDSGSANLQVGLSSSGSVDNGADRAITTTAAYWTDISELDPFTASAWTRTSVNAGLLRLNRTV